MTDHPSAAPDLQDLARRFIHFARTECPDEPVYHRLCMTAARQPELLHLLDVASPAQRRPNLLLAAVHDLVLGDARGDALSAYFPSAGGRRSVDGPTLRIGDEPAKQRAGSLWTLTMRGTRGASSEVVARSHPHGKWVEWLA